MPEFQGLHPITALRTKAGYAPFLSFAPLERFPFVKHGFSTRLGGVSKGEFSSMNLGFSRGDPGENVRENFARICASMELPLSSLVFTQQVHGTTIRRVTAQDCGKGLQRSCDHEGVDGLMTDEPEVTLVVFGADCVPVFFVDEGHRAIGVVHAGWRGTLAGICEKMTRELSAAYASRPEDLTVVIGPSICGGCYEVGDEVAELFLAAYPEDAPAALVRPKDGSGNRRLDLWEMNRRILVASGVPPERVFISGVCTCCNRERMFSHRAMGGRRGSLAGFLMLKQL